MTDTIVLTRSQIAELIDIDALFAAIRGGFASRSRDGFDARRIPFALQRARERGIGLTLDLQS